MIEKDEAEAEAVENLIPTSNPSKNTEMVIMAESTAAKLLYGLPGAVELQTTIDDVMEAYTDDYRGEAGEPHEVLIEEWATIGWPHDAIPAAKEVLDWVVDAAVERSGGRHREAYESAVASTRAHLWMLSVLSALKIDLPYRMADEKVGETRWLVVVDEDGEAEWSPSVEAS